MVWNLLSEGIINADGTPGSQFSQGGAECRVDQTPDAFLLSPPKTPFPNQVLPAPLAGGPTTPTSRATALPSRKQSENGLPSSTILFDFRRHGPEVRDSRHANYERQFAAAGPFQLTNGTTFTYNSYAASPVIASIRCGSSWIAAWRMPPMRIPPVATPPCFPGWKSP